MLQDGLYIYMRGVHTWLARVRDKHDNIYCKSATCKPLTVYEFKPTPPLLFSFPMAPGRRTVKKGETRMDAALDAMEPFGFPRKLTRTTVNKLLKVYGGNNEGWVFIEDSGYALLIEMLLEKQANSSPQVSMIEPNPGDGPDEVTPARYSDSALLPCPNTQTSDDTPLINQAIDTVLAASENGNQLPSKGVDGVSATSKLGSELPSKGVETVSATSELGNQLTLKCVDISSATSELECQSAGNLTLVENHGRKSQQLVTKLSHRKRKPCYGWITEDEGELIELPPAPLPTVFTT
ncbi:hypothetical protein Fmac_024490 [Flemingia macrophylla]|uniref:WIYLD domain-containing protein n=1 Tax=Flemingia macrophylla TaxID=520843 RepID=A0ABD1LPJ5_9FABA